MNASVLPYLASPTSRQPLEFTAPDQLREVNGTDAFPIVEGVPLLQPPGQFAEWYDEALEVVFQERSPEILAAVAAGADLNCILQDECGVDGVRNAFQRYVSLSREQRLAGFVRVADEECSAEHPLVQQRAIDDRRKYADLSYSRGHVERLCRQVDEWAFHLPGYAAAVLETGPKVIVELGTGAGLGTHSLVQAGLRSAGLITIDVDYACTGNAEGLAKVYGTEQCVDGIVAGFWFLPLRDNSIDVICSHYGIDESRETSRVVNEIARVLRPGGRFVAMCRTDAAHRLSLTFGQLGLDRRELGKLAQMADLFPGTSGLIGIAQLNGLVLETRHEMTPECSHARDLLVFRK